MKLTVIILLLSLTSVPFLASETETERQVILLENLVESQEHRANYISEELVEKFGLYIVKLGDTLAKVAKQFGTSVDNLLEWNPHITDPTKIKLVLAIRIRECEMPLSPQ